MIKCIKSKRARANGITHHHIQVSTVEMDRIKKEQMYAQERMMVRSTRARRSFQLFPGPTCVD